LTLLVLELAAGFYITRLADNRTFKLYASYRQMERRWGEPKFVQHRYIGYIPTPGYRHQKNCHNSLGYRGEEFPLAKPGGEFRIVCLGGSTTYTSLVNDYRFSYPNLLEKELKSRGYSQVRVINAGVGGYGSWETLLNFQFRVLDLDPDLVIVYHAINDVYSRLVWPPGAYRGDNSGRRITNCDSGLIKESCLLQHFNLGRIVLVRLKIRPPIHDIASRHSVVPDTYHGHECYVQKMKGIYPSGIFKKVRAMRMLHVNRPLYFERNLNHLVALAKSRGVSVVLATFAYSPHFKNAPQASSREFRYGIEEHNRLIGKIATEQQVVLFPFADRFPRNCKYYIDGRHVNVRGSRLNARLFAQYLEENQLIPRGKKM